MKKQTGYDSNDRVISIRDLQKATGKNVPAGSVGTIMGWIANNGFRKKYEIRFSTPDGLLLVRLHGSDIDRNVAPYTPIGVLTARLNETII